MNHEHLDGLTIVTERDVVETFGSIVAERIPGYPDHLRAAQLGGPGATLSRLPCQCVGVHDAATIRIRLRQDFEDMMTEKLTHPTRPLRKNSAAYRTYLESLLEAARKGEDVSPGEVAAAREGVELERLRAEGEAEREAEAEAHAERVARAAMEAPVNDELTASETNLQRTYTAALDAIHTLCEAVDQHNQLVAAGAGKTGESVTSTRYTSSATIGGTRHDFWDVETYLVNLYWAVNRRARRIKLPPRIVGGPRP